MTRSRLGFLLGMAALCCLAPAPGWAQPNATLDPPVTEGSRLDRIELQLEAVTARNQQLQQQYDALSNQYQGLLRRMGLVVPTTPVEELASPEEGVPEAAPVAGSIRREGTASGLSPYARPRTEGPRRDSIELMQNYMGAREAYRTDMPPLQYPSTVFFQDGLAFRSADGYFSLMFHNLTQLDGRVFSPTGDPLSDNFDIPRQRWYFQGDLSPYATYYTAIQRGFGSVDVLDAWIELNLFPKYREQFQVRVGRMKTPYTYEYIKMSDSDLIAPERSLFITNFGTNRQEGVMVHGRLLDLVVEYAVGVFNGGRRSFDDTNSNKDLFGYLNLKPFFHSGIEWLENLNISLSLNGGQEHNPTQPTILQTGTDQSSSVPQLDACPTFMIFKNTTIEDGARLQWAAEAAHFYRNFTMLAGYEGGTQDYATASPTSATTLAALGSTLASGSFAGVAGLHRVRVPIEGWSVAASCFVTGEEITRRVYLVEPIRPFGYYNGRFNPGAIEVYSRFSDLQLGHQVFTAGLADPRFWTNRANTIDTGINWYLNHYVRLDFDWQHCMWGNPVYLSPTEKTKHEEFYWFRTQIFF